MKYLIDAISGGILLISWLAGIVLAQGFWSTLFAVFVPLWAIYLVVEQIVLIIFK